MQPALRIAKAVTHSVRDFVLAQRDQRAREIRAKRMVGAVGIYSGEYFFAVIGGVRLYWSKKW